MRKRGETIAHDAISPRRAGPPAGPIGPRAAGRLQTARSRLRLRPSTRQGPDVRWDSRRFTHLIIEGPRFPMIRSNRADLGLRLVPASPTTALFHRLRRGLTPR